MANERGKHNPYTTNINSSANQCGSSINSVEDALRILRELLIEVERLLIIVKKERDLIESAGDNSSAATFILSRERETILNRLPVLNIHLRIVRKWWQNLNYSERSNYPEINALIQKNQNVIFMVLNSDRENEQKLLKLGRIPLNHIPDHQKQKPNFVVKLYQKNFKV